MIKELAKQYDPKNVEERIYKTWLDGKYFHAKCEEGKPTYTIVIPPPNITGQLHMGHALDNTLQDILIRWKRMSGFDTLWLPGTDHASIATEAKIVEAMRKEGVSKEDLGRDGFLERAWAWKEQYGGRIVEQLKKLGSSCDWDRERFTLDEGCNKAVNTVFKRLYDKDLIYRGNRMVNWCPCCNTSISDAEVEYEEKDGNFWHLLYTVKETGEKLELATTRPETMLGDTAVAINAEDERYKHLHGCHVILPLLNKIQNRNARLGAVVLVQAIEAILGFMVILGDEISTGSFTLVDKISVGFTADTLAKFFVALVIVGWTLVTLYACVYMKHEENEMRFFFLQIYK